MNKAYIYLARKLIELAIKELITSYPKLSFMSGFVGSIVSIFLSPIIAKLISQGVLAVDFKRIEMKVEREGEEYLKFFNNLQNVDSSQLTEQEKQDLINKAKEITKRFLSVKQYLK